MRKFLLASVAIAGLASSTFARTRSPPPATPAPDMAQMQQMQERHALMLDAHLAAMKAGLKLTGEQEKNWPAFQAAIRDAEKARADRWRQARERMAQRRAPLADRAHDDHVRASPRMAAQLQIVADASKPLYDSLTDAQKRDFGPLMRDFKMGGRGANHCRRGRRPDADRKPQVDGGSCNVGPRGSRRQSALRSVHVRTECRGRQF